MKIHHADLIDGYAREYNELEKSQGGRSLITGTVEERRRITRDILTGVASLWPPEPSVTTRDVPLPSNPAVTLRIYTPSAATTSRPLPICLYTHGGGWLSGDLATEHSIALFLSARLPCVLVSAAYRLAPEHRMPAQIDDTLAVWDFVRAGAAGLGGDASRAFAAGGSSGGHLALALAARLSALGRGGEMRACAAMFPSTCSPRHLPEGLKALHKSYVENGVDVPVIDAEAVDFAAEVAGIGDGVPPPGREERWEAKGWNWWPAFCSHEVLAGFPPTWIGAAGKDPLRDDAVVMNELLKGVGVKVELEMWEGYPHFFHVFPTLKASGEFMTKAMEGIRWALEDAMETGQGNEN